VVSNVLEVGMTPGFGALDSSFLSVTCGDLYQDRHHLNGLLPECLIVFVFSVNHHVWGVVMVAHVALQILDGLVL